MLRVTHLACLIDIVGVNVLMRIALEYVWLDLINITSLAKLDLMVTFTLIGRSRMVIQVGHCDTIRM